VFEVIHTRALYAVLFEIVPGCSSTPKFSSGFLKNLDAKKEMDYAGRRKSTAHREANYKNRIGLKGSPNFFGAESPRGCYEMLVFG
jgi:hypothetical protein